MNALVQPLSPEPDETAAEGLAFVRRRYRRDDAPAPVAWNDTLQLLLDHRSTRAFALFGHSVGRPDPARPTAVKPRLPQASVLYREQYGWSQAHAEAAESYNPRIRDFQREQGMVEKDWTVQARERTRGPSSMAGRHILRDVLNDLGFRLR